jgi:hypothetical protein
MSGGRVSKDEDKADQTGRLWGTLYNCKQAVKWLITSHLISTHGGDDSSESLVRLGAPTPDHHEVVSGINEDDIPASPHRGECILWRPGTFHLLC